MHDLNPAEVAQRIMKEVKQKIQGLNKLNVMVLGKTGVGKSTLINSVFQEPIAQTGIGKPVTSRIKKYEKADYPLSIYDTPGLELGGENAVDELLKEINTILKKSVEKNDINEAIHCVWYCISSTSHRFEESEKSFINSFITEAKQYQIPVIVVLTQSYAKKDTAQLKAEIEKEELGIAEVVPVLAQDYEIDEDYVARAFGLTRLVDVMYEVIPESVQNALIAVQKVNRQMKNAKAQAIVVSSASLAAATGATPIPFADSFLLVPEQISMLAGITAVYGLPVDQATMTAVISATIGTSGTTVLGKTLVSGLFKLIPGAGSFVGGAISASIAAALTAALGEAYIGVMNMICDGKMKADDLKTNEGKQTLTAMFRQKLGRKRDKLGKPVDAEQS